MSSGSGPFLPAREGHQSRIHTTQSAHKRVIKRCTNQQMVLAFTLVRRAYSTRSTLLPSFICNRVASQWHNFKRSSDLLNLYSGTAGGQCFLPSLPAWSHSSL